MHNALSVIALHVSLIFTSALCGCLWLQTDAAWLGLTFGEDKYQSKLPVPRAVHPSLNKWQYPLLPSANPTKNVTQSG